MDQKKYEISLEVEGSMGFFGRPDSGSESTSYPVPPYSAVKGMFEAILFDDRVQVVPYKVHICRMPQFTEAGFSARTSPLRKTGLINSGDALQRRTIALAHPLFQLFSYVKPFKNKGDKINHAHAYRDRFHRRIKQGKSAKPVCLGTSDCPATYSGPLRNETTPCHKFNTVIPLLLYHPFDRDQEGKIDQSNIRWQRNVEINEGVMHYAQPNF